MKSISMYIPARQFHRLTGDVLQVINKIKLRWFGHVMRREEESTLRVVMTLKMKGNRLTKRKTKTKVARQHQ